MKRIGSFDSLGGLMSICPPLLADEQIQGNSSNMYSNEFQSMLEGLDEEEEEGYVPEKKRRLTVIQVKALEKNFEVENKLEPERKLELAQELGLQPRQVAVWFQNRRARWKTKQLERDYGLLKANFDALNLKFQNLQHDNQALNTEIHDLKSKLLQDDKEVSLNEDDKDMDQLTSKIKSPPLDLDDDDNTMIEECNTEVAANAFNNSNYGLMGTSILIDFKDGSSDSTDSSTILNNGSPNANQYGSSSSSSSLAMSGFQFSDKKAGIFRDAHKLYLPKFVKIEEHNFFSEDDESCSTIFIDDQPPTLPWDFHEEWK